MSDEAVVNDVMPMSEETVQSLSSNRQTSTSITISWLAPVKDGVSDYRVRFVKT